MNNSFPNTILTSPSNEYFALETSLNDNLKDIYE